MTNDVNASEKRLIAALERIDRAVDQALLRARAEPAAQDDAAMRDENQRLSQELAALQAGQSESLNACHARLSEAHDRLVTLGQEAAQLAAANEALVAANRALTENLTPDAVQAALQAEIDSLRTTRAAEIAQMNDLIEMVDRMTAPPAPRTPPMIETPPPPRAAAVAEAIADEAPIEAQADIPADLDQERAEHGAG